MTTILSSIVNIIGGEGGGDLYNLFNEHENPQFDDESDLHIELQKYEGSAYGLHLNLQTISY